MRFLSHFKPASSFTKEVFNPYGMKPYDAIRECQIRTDGHAPVDLTIIHHNDGLYSFAHGEVINPQKFKTMTATASSCLKWYESNLSQFKLASINS